MKIPRRLEWRAGVGLFASSLSALGLLIALILVKVDIGMELKSSLRQTGQGWTLSSELPVERLDIMRRCRQVRLIDSDRHVWYAPFSSIGGRWNPEEGKMTIRIVITSPPPPSWAVTDSTSVQAMLVKRRSVPVLKAMFESVLRSPQG